MHPPSIKQIPKSINQRLSYLSSDQQSFDRSKPVYESALKQSNYNFPLQYSNRDATKPPPTTKRKRHRNVIWYNPPFSKSVKSNIARNFLQLIDKHFPKTNPLHRIFNRYKKFNIAPQQPNPVKTQDSTKFVATKLQLQETYWLPS